MSLLKRFNNVVRAHLNDWLDKAEDPQKLHAQKILDLEQSKKSAQQLLISAMSSLKLAKSKQASIEEKIESLKSTNSQNETQSLEQNYREMKSIIEEEEKTINMINHGLKALENKILLLKNSPCNTHLSPSSDTKNQPDYVNDSHALDTFKRMEEKIEANEAEVEALGELLSYLENKEPTQEAKSGPSLEEELAKLKKKLEQK
ncbi:MAG: PspA/IM30 family protein [Myxococcales bacterium]|nr:PspA/IM30 family protein [Myxococcales bacterium]USN50478.1 MAG: PspA/IM30 family protein [Myxococcales bacterium]